ncbi:polysaccharide biosynthesis C-terminal domain-containing protein [Natrinema longum]|uniref:Oligosaccharide flippase family protein n=1 Tax=Natrinema longum TaxID=370324 RepID=A0A8A2U790_9EURY|nr:polysaccharide biosynthesis C-terminal domain-containing protein [Natrinema longum]MBZ6494565.1 oligosaccharide flippase family protein [Natrinema longum]QSW84115.1 oligosaccharide flippase family protein [Natrinema longum]
MRLGQTSVIHFTSRFFASLLGFVATIFIARFLGSGTLGTYYLVLSTVSWLGIAVEMGVPSAINKRVSEDEDEAAYAIAGGVIAFCLFLVVSVLILLFRHHINDYIGYPAAQIVVLFLFVNLIQSSVNSILNGQHLVHISGIFNPIRTGTRSIVQISAILLGLKITGLFIGYTAGYALVSVLGLWIAVRNFPSVSLPTLEHYRRIISYAEYSWLGEIRSRAFNWVDVAVLGFFVSSSLVGIYTAAWNIAVFLILFGGSLSQTLFPEMSSLSAEEDAQSVADLFETALTYGGLILIPGLVGGTLLGERLLRIYGEEFTQGTVVLSVLIVATLIQGYQRQFTTTLDAIDRPDVSFRVNAVFIGANVILNVSLIPPFEVVGAAAATAASVAISLVVAYFSLSSLIEFSVPLGEIGKQWTAAAVMGVVVYTGLWLESAHISVGNNLVVVITLVGFGAAVYFGTLFAISSYFRTTVDQNLPIDFPTV